MMPLIWVDQFALKLGYKDELAKALIKLQVKNLSAMDADWLYSAYTYSHPILIERLRALGYKGEGKAS
jgi:STE24 endopeptidase